MKKRKSERYKRYRATKRYYIERHGRCRCFYCVANRQYANLKRCISAEEKMKEYRQSALQADFFKQKEAV